MSTLRTPFSRKEEERPFVTAPTTTRFSPVMQAGAGVAPVTTEFSGGVVAVFGVDRLGRRALLLSGTSIMILAAAALGASFANAAHPSATLALLSLVAFIIGWDVSWAGLMLTLIAEVLPQNVCRSGSSPLTSRQRVK